MDAGRDLPGKGCRGRDAERGLPGKRERRARKVERCDLREKTDNELMELAGQDDREAFETLVLRYYREAIRAAERMVHDKMQAEDIAQDCFADIYVQRRRYKPSCSFRTYLYALVKHKSVDYLRKSGGREGLLEAEKLCWLEEQPGPEGSPEEEYLKRERVREAAEQIGSLPQVQRRALYLYAVEDRSYQEIAGILHKSIPQIKIAIHRARKKLTGERE